MNKKVFQSISLYSLAVVIAVLLLTASAAILSISKATTKQTQSLNVSSASDLKVQDTGPSKAPSISEGGSGGASSNGAVTLQAGQAAPVPTGTAYPCANCPEASSTADVMVCDDYCVSPQPTPVPPANPYPQCDTCHGNTYGVSGSMVMCPMIACRYQE